MFKNFYNHSEPRSYHCLPQEFINDPHKMIYAFCDAFELECCKERLWNLLKGLIGSDDMDSLDHIQRSNYIFFCEYLQKLIEASYIIYERQKA